MINPATVAISAAVFASYVLGSLWYLAIGKKWRTSLGWTDGSVPYRPKPVELAIAFLGQVLMALVLWVAIVHENSFGVEEGALVGAVIWLGFVIPTLTTNIVFQRRSLALIWQDGGH